MLFLDITQKDGLLREPIACYEIANRTFDFVMTYVENRTINMTLVMLFLVWHHHLHFASTVVYKIFW